MEKKWQDIVTDSNERKLFEALADPAWDFRTIDGLVRVTGLSEPEVQGIITKYEPRGLIRQSTVPSKKGEALFTLPSSGFSAGEVFSIIRSTITKTSS